MQRITTVLKTSEAMAVRKAVCIAGGERVVITPLSRPVRVVELPDIGGNNRLAASDIYLRLDVTANDGRSDRIVSAIRGIVRAVDIIVASPRGNLPRIVR